jgi:hypothetical protein
VGVRGSLLFLFCAEEDVSHVAEFLGDERRTAGLHLARRLRYLRGSRCRRRHWMRCRVRVWHRWLQMGVLNARVRSAVADVVTAGAVVVPLQFPRLHCRDVDDEADDHGDEAQDPSCGEHPRPHPVAHRSRPPPVAEVPGLHADADHEQHLREAEADPTHAKGVINNNISRQMREAACMAAR